ncbi:hypothetical protein GSI_09010 [Ganoderma sinense ZZ0214-1]|uniref:Uncharacterized protein n=1 Tax=Ganoderma sinense ZZ0214-1 TaxID=1077348 RepID=A0A2G8S5B1_9APHY|nr:hypothetical protein GSI_09010 [Ganoderma sinense ZZ0214-1]
MRSLNLPTAAIDDHPIISISVLTGTDNDNPSPFANPAEANDPPPPSISDANQGPQADAPPDTPTPIPSTNTDSISLVSSSTVPPSYHTQHSSRDLQFFPVSPSVPLPLRSPQEPPTPPPALVPERRPRQSRVRGPRSRGASQTLPRSMAVDPPPRRSPAP